MKYTINVNNSKGISVKNKYNKYVFIFVCEGATNNIYLSLRGRRQMCMRHRGKVEAEDDGDSPLFAMN